MVSPRKPAKIQSHWGWRVPATVNNLRRAWKFAFELQDNLPPNPHFRVAIFGSARVKPGHPKFPLVYAKTKALAYCLSCHGIDTVTGGGPGLMAAANRGCKRAEHIGPKTKSHGRRIRLPFEEETNPDIDQVFTHLGFGSRLHDFDVSCSGYVAMDGGVGTDLEVFWVWQGKQVGHIPREHPLILVGDVWSGLIKWVRDVQVAGGFMSPEDMQLVRQVANWKEALPILLEAHQRFLDQKR